MSITKTKEVEIPANMSLMEYAQNTKGIYVNLLNLCGRSPAGKYEFRYMLSNKNLLGEKVKFQMGAEETEASVIYSCLGTDYKNQKKYRREFKEAVDQLVKDYKNQERVEAHLATENYTLAEMRKKGLI
mgnify:CR=1 FL=1|jgi:hypothetical protein